MSQDTLKLILESCNLVPRIKISKCKVEVLRKFKLSPRIDYKTKYLDLEGTLNDSDSEYIDAYGAKNLFRAMKKTNMSQNLEYIYTSKK